MIAKVNVEIELASLRKVFVELWDRDLIQDDLIESQLIESSGLVEFIFRIQEWCELNPELKIRVKNYIPFELHKLKFVNSLET